MFFGVGGEVSPYAAIARRVGEPCGVNFLRGLDSKASRDTRLPPRSVRF